MSTRKSLLFSFLDRYAGLAITVLSSMVLARLLSPAEIGVFSVTMVLLMFVSTVRDMGAGQYLVQEKNLTLERIRAVWTVQLGLGLGLACVVVLASYPVAVFYDEPRMRDIMLVVALNYVITPFGSLTHAWLMREMRFQSSALIRFSGGVCGALVAIWMAWKNHGPISLAFGSLTTTLVGAMMAVYFRPRFFPWLPGLGEIKRVLVFGSQLTASSVVATISNGAPELVLGKLQDLAAAGLFSRANGLVQMFHRLFVDAVGAVCLPWFARELRQGATIETPFLKATAYVTALGWSFCLAVIFLAHPLVRAMYGHQWDQSVDLARLLAVAMIVRVPTALGAIALLSAGAVTTIARATIASAVLGVALVVFGASQGLMALGLVLIGSEALNSAIWLRAMSRHIDVHLGALLRSLRQSAAVAMVATIGPALAFGVYGPYPDSLVMPLVLGGVGELAGFVVGVMLFQHPLQTEIRMLWGKVRQALA